MKSKWEWYYVILALVELVAVLMVGGVLLWRIVTGGSPDLLTDTVLLLLLTGAHWEPSAQSIRRNQQET